MFSQRPVASSGRRRRCWEAQGSVKQQEGSGVPGGELCLGKPRTLRGRVLPSGTQLVCLESTARGGPQPVLKTRLLGAAVRSQHVSREDRAALSGSGARPT